MDHQRDELIQLLRSKDTNISYEKAGMLIDLLKEDFEATYAKAGYEYQGQEMAQRVVEQWIQSYGGRIHEIAAMNERYAAILSGDDDVKQ
ncbi:YfhJ family protein [Jeotgalibacillus sp. R-1-5s-1]|uniref:YfhJ family protein n=1 Tax=Jeotgalibacillus sp. R-1-5s-1 TaxID=2555897 RepID=UPI001FC8CC2E|nr:YfhJ family protein [Jeotgalibacillus sp. R-1-5s-1]